MPAPPLRDRRAFLKALSAASAALALGLPGRDALTEAARAETEFFVFIHAAGGWDVTLWADPRNERRGLVQPASTDNTDTAAIRRWVDAPLDEGARSFRPVQPPGSRIVFGPAIGDLADHYDRLTVLNGVAMNTVSHPDGSAFSATGRHLVGGRSVAPSIDTMMANESGKGQTFPVVSVQFPSFFVGEGLDRRVVPLMVGQIGSISRSLARSQAYDSDDERDLVTQLLGDEARELASRSARPGPYQGMALQYESLRKMLGSRLQDVFSADALRKARPELNYKARFAGGAAVNAAFAVEAMRRDVVRCVSFAVGGFDTHQSNYRTHAQLQQETFDLLAAWLRVLDQTPHPSLSGHKLSEHVHVLMVSEFCRTPQINAGGGRDHYPNNSALVISPRFKGNTVFGRSDPDQLLPLAVRRFREGERPLGPPDLLATFVSAFGVEPRKYLRDGEVVSELLRA